LTKYIQGIEKLVNEAITSEKVIDKLCSNLYDEGTVVLFLYRDIYGLYTF